MILKLLCPQSVSIAPKDCGIFDLKHILIGLIALCATDRHCKSTALDELMLIGRVCLQARPGLTVLLRLLRPAMLAHQIMTEAILFSLHA